MEIFNPAGHSYISQAINPERREPGRSQRRCFYRSGPKIYLLDSFNGYTNGQAYGSVNLLKSIRTRRVVHPSGPTDLYKFPVTSNMEYGWNVVKTSDDNSGESFGASECRTVI